MKAKGDSRNERTRVLLLAALLGVGCSSSGGSSSHEACVYQTRNVFACNGYYPSSDWQTECADQPCGTLSWDPNEMQTDDCYSATEYQGSTKYAGTCADWQASGSPTDPNAPSSSGSSGSSGSGGGGSATSCNSAQWQSQLSAACQSCEMQYCCAQAQACDTGTQCDAQLTCNVACTSTDPSCDSADAGVCPCLNGCANMYPAAASAVNAFGQCLETQCLSPCGG